MKVFPSSYSYNTAAESVLTDSDSSNCSTFRLSNFTIGLLICASLIFSLIIAKLGLAAGALILIVMIGLPTIYSVVVYPEIGILVLLIASYLLMWIIRMGVNFPLGTLMDALEVLLLLGFFIKQKSDPDWSFLKLSVSKIIIVWILYNFIEVVNPAASSVFSWLYTIRTVATVMLLYFVFVYQIRSVQYIRILLKVWIGLSFFAAVYAFKQEYFGFFAFERAQLNDPTMISLLFINGVWRKFSIFSDPVSFSYNMVISSLLCICLLTGTFKTWKKVILLLLALFFLMNMLYSGTRGAYVLVPAALVLIAILNYSKKVLLISMVAGVLIGIMIVIPTTNLTLYRFQSAFKPSSDASYNVRVENQKRIRPYILSHPFGGGLGSTGVWGVRFAPKSYLAKFPPDSGYVRVAVELGYVGLFLICMMMFLILKTGIKNYFRIKNPELKAYCLAATTIIFALTIGNFPQEAIVQFPTNILFFFAAALITITFKLDQIPDKNVTDRTSIN